MKTFKKIANVDEFEPGRSKLFRLNGVGIAVFNSDGAFYAVQDFCAGDGGSLAAGTMVGSAVVCAFDKALFYLPTGECVDPPHLKRLTVYEVRIAGSEIQIALEEAPSSAGLSRRDYEMDRPSA
jgi:3-phenylpropionate/trans-cinnamate dioxygenase ferredoxin component